VSARPGEHSLDHETLRSEIQRTIGEIGAMTALDGATILDRQLGLCGFGVVLPVRADVSVLEVVDAAGTVRRPFFLEQYGARHRAAASYAATHTGSLVFIASVSGDIGCMLSEEPSQVLLWRFRSRDLSSPSP
jgi:DNA integrity scanning protein DisA with diadenylate cyclase activity